ncbi:hypothetical protein BJ742DRAFT_298276 [Cladochytrium replicatum]|nr:hypothetical protein BJ742DRAFT_298276 [Cladochytrium replicatum]
MPLSLLGRLCATVCTGAVLAAGVLLIITPLGEVHNLSVATGFRRLIVLDNPRYSEVSVTLPGLSTGVSAYLFDSRPAVDLSIRLPEISYHVNFEGLGHSPGELSKKIEL